MSRAWALGAVGLAFAAQPLLAGGYEIAGLSLAVACAWAVRRAGLGWPAAGSPGGGLPPALVAGIFLVALAARTWNAASVPPVWWDEGVETYDARCIAAGLPLEPLTGIHYHRSPLWSRVISVAGRIGDFSFAALRVPSAVAGAAAVAVTTVVARRLLGPGPALVATGWLVLHPWELHLSRIMMGNVSVPLAGAAIVFVAGVARWSPVVRGALSGSLAGVAVWGYAAALALPGLAAAAVWLLSPHRQRARCLAACVAASVVIAAPTLVLAPGMWEKTRQVSAAGSPGVLGGNLARSVRMFHMEGDTDLRHNYPAGAPVFRSWLAPVFTLGLAVAAAGLRSPGAAVTLIWLALGLLPGLASAGGAANQFRMAGVPPAAGLVLAAGAACLPAALGSRLGWGLAAALVVAGAGRDARAYFHEMPRDPATVTWYRTWARDAGEALVRLAAVRPMTVMPPLDLVRHPLEKALLFDAIRSGRIRFASAAEPGAGTRTVYTDPWGEPQSAIVVGGGRVRYLTVADAAEAADVLVKTGRPDEAEHGIRAALAVLPESVLLRERLGFALLARGRLPAAEAEFRRVVVRRPAQGAAWDGLGAALFRQGRLREALGAVEEAVRVAPDEPEYRRDRDRIRAALAGRMEP